MKLRRSVGRRGKQERIQNRKEGNSCGTVNCGRRFALQAMRSWDGLWGPSALEHRRTWASAFVTYGFSAFVIYGFCICHMGFSHRRSVPRWLYRTLHGLLGAQLSSACFDLSVCLQPVYHFLYRSDWLANPIACASFPPPHPAPSVDSLDSELWYRFGCRAAALASAAPRPLGSLFRQLFTTQSALRG
jgi:hypothetical protein